MKASSDVPLDVNESNVFNFQVMACDGLWDVMSSADVISIIKDTVKEPGLCSSQILATEASERGSRDKIIVNKIDDFLAEKNGHPTLPLVEISNSQIKLN
ncbi:hypothetical protein Peur_031508 [Populus x canadensis]